MVPTRGSRVGREREVEEEREREKEGVGRERERYSETIRPYHRQPGEILFGGALSSLVRIQQKHPPYCLEAVA